MSYPPPPPPGGPFPGGYGAAPVQDEKTWALLAHVGTFALGFLAPLLVMLTKGNESGFVRRHAVESLNFQISLLIYLTASAVLILVLIGILLMIAVGVFAFVVVILATIKAANGEDYRYPLCIRLVT